MQTGTQLLSGFLLAVAFQPRFSDLDALQRTLYLVLVICAAVATLLALTPVVMHRALFRERRKPQLVSLASRIVQIALAVIGLLSVGVMVLIVDFTVGRIAAVVVLIIGGVLVLALWVVMPRWMRRA